MRDLIVNSLELLCKIGVFLFIIAGTGAGILTGNPYAVICGLVASFIISTIVFGLLFLLIDINDNIRAVRYLLEKNEKS